MAPTLLEAEQSRRWKSIAELINEELGQKEFDDRMHYLDLDFFLGPKIMDFPKVSAQLEDSSGECYQRHAIYRIVRQSGFGTLFKMGETIGKYIGLPFGNYFYDVLFFRVGSIEEESEGFKIQPHPNDPTAHFYQFKRHKNGKLHGGWSQVAQPASCHGVTGVELFVPKHIFRWFRDMAYVVGDNLPLSITGNPQLIGMKYSGKSHFTDEEIIDRDPELYRAINQLLKQKALTDSVMQKLCKSWKMELAEKGIDAQVSYRTKTIPGIYGSLGRGVPERSPDTLTDINGIRIVVPTTNDCYRTMYILLSQEVVKEQGWMNLNDHIAVPKPNGYQVLRWNFGRKRSLEVQVQTQGMVENAERGAAASYRLGEQSSALRT